jgi:hypothetical protein
MNSAARNGCVSTRVREEKSLVSELFVGRCCEARTHFGTDTDALQFCLAIMGSGEVLE